MIEKEPWAAILVETPLGLKLLKRALEEKRARILYGLSLQGLMTPAYHLRADVVMIHDPVGLRPGIYPCTRGFSRSSGYASYMGRFPRNHVEVIDVNRPIYMELGWTKSEVIEVKTGHISEQAIGQPLTYEALMRMDN